jgi:hypothetical protein
VAGIILALIVLTDWEMLTIGWKDRQPVGDRFDVGLRDGTLGEETWFSRFGVRKLNDGERSEDELGKSGNGLSKGALISVCVGTLTFTGDDRKSARSSSLSKELSYCPNGSPFSSEGRRLVCG